MYWDSFIQWVNGPTATAISFAINLIGIILYFHQRRENKNLSLIVNDYEIKEKLSNDKRRMEEEYGNEKKKKENLEQDLNYLEESLPIEAKRAYIKNTIPIIQKEIFDLSNQLNKMVNEQKELGDSPHRVSLETASILSDEVKRHLGVRARIENTQILLSVFVGTTATLSFFLISANRYFIIPFLLLTAYFSTKLLLLWRVQYIENKIIKIPLYFKNPCYISKPEHLFLSLIGFVSGILSFFYAIFALTDYDTYYRSGISMITGMMMIGLILMIFTVYFYIYGRKQINVKSSD